MTEAIKKDAEQCAAKLKEALKSWINDPSNTEVTWDNFLAYQTRPIKLTRPGKPDPTLSVRSWDNFDAFNAAYLLIAAFQQVKTYGLTVVNKDMERGIVGPSPIRPQTQLHYLL